MMECTAHRGMAGVTFGSEVFTDLDFEDDVALLAEMLEVLVLAKHQTGYQIHALQRALITSSCQIYKYDFANYHHCTVKLETFC